MCGCDSIVEDDGTFVCTECGAMQTRFRDEASEDSGFEGEPGALKARRTFHDKVVSRRGGGRALETLIHKVPLRQAIVRESRVEIMLKAQNLIYDLVSEAATTAGVSPSSAVTEAIRLWYLYLDHASRVSNALFVGTEICMQNKKDVIGEDDVEALIQKDTKLPPAVLRDAILYVRAHIKTRLTPGSRTAYRGPSTKARELDIPALSPALLLALVWMTLVNMGVPIFPAEIISWLLDGPLRKHHADILSLITEKNLQKSAVLKHKKNSIPRLTRCVGALHYISARATEKAACALKALGLPIAEVSPFAALTRLGGQLHMGKRPLALARSLLGFALDPESEKVEEGILKELKDLVRLSVPFRRFDCHSREYLWHQHSAVNIAFHHYPLSFVVAASLYLASAVLKLLDPTPPERLTKISDIFRGSGPDLKVRRKKFVKYSRRLRKLKLRADAKSEKAQQSIDTYTKKLSRYQPKSGTEAAELDFQVEGQGKDMHIKGLDVRWDSLPSEAKQAFWLFCDDFAPRPQALAGIPYPAPLTFEQARKKKRSSRNTAVSEHVATFSAVVRYEPLQRMSDECDRATEVSHIYRPELSRDLHLDLFLSLVSDSISAKVRLSACYHLLLCAEELKVAILQYHEPRIVAARERVQIPPLQECHQPLAAPLGGVLGANIPVTLEETAASGSVVLPIFDLSQRGTQGDGLEPQVGQTQSATGNKVLQGQKDKGEHSARSSGARAGISQELAPTALPKRRRISQKSSPAAAAAAVEAPSGEAGLEKSGQAKLASSSVFKKRRKSRGPNPAR